MARPARRGPAFGRRLDARARTGGADDQPLPDALHNWIARALQLEVRQGFQSATEAQVALEDALAEDSGFVPAPVSVETFLSRYSAAMLESPAPAPPPLAPVAPMPVAIVSPAAPAWPEPPKVEPPPSPRDITDLLRDFDLPPVPAPAAATHAARLAPSGAGSQPIVAAAPKRLSRFTIPSGGAARWRRIAVLACAIVALGEGGVIAARALRKPPPKLGSLSLQTNPPGVAVFVDGVARGNTPARISLDAGSHIVELRGRGVPRVIPMTVTAGAEATQYLELPETPSVGSLLVQSDPAGARLTVDGVDHGVAPASVTSLVPGEHEVVLQAEGGTPVRQRVVIQAGVTSSVLTPVATATPGPVSGWVSLRSPVAIEVHENGRLIGTTDADRIMMAAGRHDVELVNDTLGYRVTRSIQVPPGKVMPLIVEMPQGVINVNASPWAEVWVDGRRVGETPIGNLPMAIGPHEVVFRHPQLGEKRQAVSVTLKAPVRISIDMK